MTEQYLITPELEGIPVDDGAEPDDAGVDEDTV